MLNLWRKGGGEWEGKQQQHEKIKHDLAETSDLLAIVLEWVCVLQCVLLCSSWFSSPQSSADRSPAVHPSSDCSSSRFFCPPFLRSSICQIEDVVDVFLAGHSRLAFAQVTAHLYVSTCPVECRLPWRNGLGISGPWRLPRRVIIPILLMHLSASHTSDEDVDAAFNLESFSPDWHGTSSASRIWKESHFLLSVKPWPDWIYSWPDQSF